MASLSWVLNLLLSYLTCNTTVSLLQINFIQLNAAPTTGKNSDLFQVMPAKTCVNKAAIVDCECYQVVSYPTEGNPLFSYLEIIIIWKYCNSYRRRDI